jgi:uncharacterized protein YdaL
MGRFYVNPLTRLSILVLLGLCCSAAPGWTKRKRVHVPAPPAPTRKVTITPERHGIHKMRVKKARTQTSPRTLQTVTRAVAPDSRVLILYDATTPYEWLGELHGKMLINLMSHFNLQAELKPAAAYVAGEVEGYRALFYLGTVYGAALPAPFLDDILTTAKPICWMGMNLWQLAWTEYWAPDAEFEAKFGMRFTGLDAADYTLVNYKGVNLARHPDLQALGVMNILDATKAQHYAMAMTADTTQVTPFISRGANLWYVGESPFSYVEHSDRYLAFADLLHDILGINHVEEHRSLVRLEDISPYTPTDRLKAMGAYLYQQKVPFAMVVVPEYRDPFGYYNDGVPLTISMNSLAARPFVTALRYNIARGGKIIQHGYTHQYKTIANPYYGVTAEDFEFFRIDLDAAGRGIPVGPVPEDSATWALDRVRTGLSQFTAVGLTPIAWETPHYMASEVDYAVFAQCYTLATDRGVYFVTGADGTVYFANQMAPYLIPRDIYGQKRLPDTLGYIDLYGTGSPTGALSLPADVIARARAMQVVRDGWANFYFHWDLDLNYLKQTVTGLKQLGVKFSPLDPNVR